MTILGLSGGLETSYENRLGILDNTVNHDSAAALIVDGRVVSAIEEERLNRIKHTNMFPILAIRFVLDNMHINLAQVDKIVYYGNEDSHNEYLAGLIRKGAIDSQFVDIRSYLCHIFKEFFNIVVPQDQIFFIDHHLAHASSAYYLSGFADSLILTLDATGDGLSTGIYKGESSTIRQIAVFPDKTSSLGWFYLAVINYLGFSFFDEYKAMGLAPYGDPQRFSKLFKSFYKLCPNGEYHIRFPFINQLAEIAEPRKKNDSFTKTHKDIAASLQDTLETIIFHILNYYKDVVKSSHLCLAGGVAHNCSVNGKIANSGLFKRMFVQPAACDAGSAIGAALYLYYQDKKEDDTHRMHDVYFGTSIGSDAQIEMELESWRDFLRYSHSDNITEEAADLLCEDKIIGWVQGRSEFGPRALGNRSILADPRKKKNIELINQIVKKREAFRPFAPSVTIESASQFFEIPSCLEDSPFMTYVVNVREETREKLGAVTHVDGTARFQTVSKEQNEIYWHLLHAFGKRTGLPILLNTSFNNNVEPIVNSVQDAITCFLTADIDVLVVGNYIIEKREKEDWTFENITMKLPLHCYLSCRRVDSTQVENPYKYSISVSYSHRYTREISRDLYTILSNALNTVNLKDAYAKFNLDSNQRKNILHEIFDLWKRRMLLVEPK